MGTRIEWSQMKRMGIQIFREGLCHVEGEEGCTPEIPIPRQPSLIMEILEIVIALLWGFHIARFPAMPEFLLSNFRYFRP